MKVPLCTSGSLVLLTALMLGVAWPAAAMQQGRPVPATLLVHGQDFLEDQEDEISSPDPDLHGTRAALLRTSLIEVGADQQAAQRLWVRHGLPGEPPAVPAHHVVAVIRIEDGDPSCSNRRFGNAVEVEGAVEVVLPVDASHCGQPGTHGDVSRSIHDVYVVLLDVSQVAPGTEIVRVRTAWGAGEMKVAAETVVPLPVSPTLPRTGVAVGWWVLAAACLILGGSLVRASRRLEGSP